MPRPLIAAAIVLLLTPAFGRAAVMSLSPPGEGHQIRVGLAELPEITTRVLEVVDPATGAVLRTVWADRARTEQTITLTEALHLKPGKYALRYRDGLGLEYAEKLDGPVGGKWTNPCDIRFTPDAIFVMESSEWIGNIPAEVTRSRVWHQVDGTVFRGGYYRPRGAALVLLTNPAGNATAYRLDSFTPEDQKRLHDLETKRAAFQAKINEHAGKIWKLSRDGKVDTAFGTNGFITVWQDRYADIRSFAISSDGKIFFSDTYHSAVAYGRDGKRINFSVGGWDNKPTGPVCTGWLNTLAMGPGDRLYIPTAYGMFRVYDATKRGFEGILYSTTIPEGEGYAGCVGLDGMGGVYLVAADNSISKFKDDGKSLTRLWKLPAPGGIGKLTQPSYSAGLLWVSDHGPSKGPFWDSGGGGQVLLFWDDGERAHLVGRFGTIGDAADKAEFVDPSAVQMTDDHLGLWVVEDGYPYAEGPHGGARIRKFHVTAAHTETMEIDLTGWR
jgi:hypothetical protein